MILVGTSTEQSLKSPFASVTIESNVESEICKKINDYEPCLKNTCPDHMPCYCRENKEYCRCPNFKGPLGDYWNMGPNCEQQWNIRDLILVAILPGVSLAMVVGVCMHCVYSYNKRKYIAKASKGVTNKKVTRSEAKSKHSVMNIYHQNDAFVEDTETQQKSTDYPWKIPKVNVPSMEYLYNPEANYIPKVNIRSIKPELNKIREQIPLPMEHAKSSYEASQHFIPPYPPRNDDIWQDNGMPPATSSAKPKGLNGIQVLPSNATGSRFNKESPIEHPGNQHIGNHFAIPRPQYGGREIL